MTRRAHKSVKLFCSYSHKDERYLNKLKTCLAGLRRQGLIEEWHDRKILPGQEWEEAIDEALEASEIILLLVTPDFMSSDYSFEKEMTRALDKHKQGETRVIYKDSVGFHEDQPTVLETVLNRFVILGQSLQMRSY